MTFSIELIPETERTADGERLGRIRVGEFTERFVVAALPGMIVEALPNEWGRRLRHFLAGAEAVALMTQPHEMWVLYRCDEIVFVQNQLLTPEWPGSISDDGRVCRVPARRTRTEDGDPISEWETSTEAVRSFLDRYDRPT